MEAQTHSWNGSVISGYDPKPLAMDSLACGALLNLAILETSLNDRSQSRDHYPSLDYIG